MCRSSTEVTLEPGLFNKSSILLRFMNVITMRYNMAEMFGMVAAFAFGVIRRMFFAHDIPHILGFSTNFLIGKAPKHLW